MTMPEMVKDYQPMFDIVPQYNQEVMELHVLDQAARRQGAARFPFHKDTFDNINSGGPVDITKIICVSDHVKLTQFARIHRKYKWDISVLPGVRLEIEPK